MGALNGAILEVEYGGSDTANGGGFYINATTNDLSVTSGTTTAPVASSASYNFQSSDVGAWLFISGGSHWIPGWYQIVSVASNKATLNATAGSAPLYDSYFTGSSVAMSSVNGCVNGSYVSGTASGQWSIDYSQQTSNISISGATTSGANATLLWSGATKAMINNTVVITGGTNFTAGYYYVTGATAGVSLTLNTTCATGVGSGGTGGLGGALASLGMAGYLSTNPTVFQKYSASTYQITTATANVSGGILVTNSGGYACGYGTNRNTGNVDAQIPLNQYQSGVTSVGMFSTSNNPWSFVRSIAIDGNNQTGSIGFNYSANYVYNCIAKNCVSAGFYGANCFYCLALSCVTGFYSSGAYWCAAINCSTHNFGTQYGFCMNCVAAGGAGAGFYGAAGSMINCTAYGCGGGGFGCDRGTTFLNCISYGNTGYGFWNYNNPGGYSQNCATGNNSSGANDGNYEFYINNIALTANPFVNAGATINTLADVWTNYALNTTAGGGAACMAAGIGGSQNIGAVGNQSSSGGGLVGAANQRGNFVN